MENNPFPVIFAGRSYPIAESRPSLVVVTDKGSYSLGARANASWSISTYMPGGGSNKFTLDGQGPSIVQFDLTPVKGTVKSAKLSITAISQGI